MSQVPNRFQAGMVGLVKMAIIAAFTIFVPLLSSWPQYLHVVMTVNGCH